MRLVRSAVTARPEPQTRKERCPERLSRRSAIPPPFKIACRQCDPATDAMSLPRSDSRPHPLSAPLARWIAPRHTRGRRRDLPPGDHVHTTCNPISPPAPPRVASVFTSTFPSVNACISPPATCRKSPAAAPSESVDPGEDSPSMTSKPFPNAGLAAGASRLATKSPHHEEKTGRSIAPSDREGASCQRSSVSPEGPTTHL